MHKQAVILVLVLATSAFAKPRIYLGGPDVFYPNPKAIAETKKQISEKYGFEGVFPLDNEITPEPTPMATGLKLFQANVNLMKTCDLMVANMTPFRGPSMDAGTSFEMGYMMASGKPVLAYTEDPRDFKTRTVAFVNRLGGTVTQTDDGVLRDPDNFSLENFGMVDNLMLHGVVHFSLPNGVAIEKSFEDAVRKNADRLHAYFRAQAKK